MSIYASVPEEMGIHDMEHRNPNKLYITSIKHESTSFRACHEIITEEAYHIQYHVYSRVCFASWLFISQAVRDKEPLWASMPWRWCCFGQGSSESSGRRPRCGSRPVLQIGV